ncbi:MAG: DUF3575 domain-containing protein [Alistipes sp.]|nr:DUF3575 domain-containing protein [Alistipes sp.]
MSERCVARGGDLQPVGSTSVAESFALYYRNDRIDIDEEYLDNSVRINHIKDYLARSPRIDSITVYAYASPEGIYERNVLLARKRAEAAKRFILANIPADREFDPSSIRLRPMGENWDGLRREIEAEYHRTDRARVLEILDASVGNDTKKWRLRQLDNGNTYKYIIRNHMPELRLATWICVWTHPVEKCEMTPPVEIRFDKPAAVRPVGSTPEIATAAQAALRPEYDKRTVLALKTNMLYDAATWLNFAVEVPFGRRFSLLYEHHCPWWVTGSNRYCLEFLSFGGEFRWWVAPRPRGESSKLVKRDALVGHFIGLYGMGGKFDLQAKRAGCYQGEFISIGLTYGYSMPLCKRLNIEFSISAGYAEIPHRHYIPTANYDLLIRDRSKSGTWHYVGPTKIEIALVCPILAKYRKKGGNR